MWKIILEFRGLEKHLAGFVPRFGVAMCTILSDWGYPGRRTCLLAYWN